MDQVKNKTLIDILLEKNRITNSEAAGFSKSLDNEEIEKRLRAQNLVSSEDIAKAYAVVYDLPFIRLENYEIKPDALAMIPKEVSEKDQVIAFEKGENRVKVAVARPAHLKTNPPAAINELKAKNILVDIHITTPEDISRALYHPVHSPVEVKNLDHEVKNLPASQLKTVDLVLEKIPYEVISKFPLEISQKYKMIVFANPEPDLIRVAIADPSDRRVQEILDFVRDKNDIKIEEFVASPAEIDQALKTYYRKPEKASVSVEQEIPSALAENIDEIVSPIQPITDEASKPKNPAEGRRKFIRRPLSYQLQQEKVAAEQAAASPHHDDENDQISTIIAPENDLDQFLGEEIKDIQALKNIIQTGNVPHILAATVALAVFMKASDIHIEAGDKDLRFRYRVDGVLRDVIKVPLTLQPALISRVKILSRLKIDETRVPQDGRFDVRTQNHEIDLRVSTLPTVRGEKIALRILDKTQSIYNLEDLGFVGRNLKIVRENINKPYGVILSTGPTGSGKSTTLYSILKEIANASVNVITLEDPVEYEIPGINQCQVKPKIGFSFAEGLRSVLRQDPNIIMVGEIRDAETAGMATHAALTGHLVLTTLHTNDAPGALPRLTNMGIEPFLITSSILVVIGQRLVRKVCPKCKQEIQLPEPMMQEIEKELAKFDLPKPYKFYEGKGCPGCNNGFSGRIGIFEVLTMSEKIEMLAIQRRPASEIKAAAVSEGMVTMKQDGLIKATKGLTTVGEILRVTLTE